MSRSQPTTTGCERSEGASVELPGPAVPGRPRGDPARAAGAVGLAPAAGQVRDPLPGGGDAVRGRRAHGPRPQDHPAGAVGDEPRRPGHRARAAGGDDRGAGREGVGDARERHVGLDERRRRLSHAARGRAGGGERLPRQGPEAAPRRLGLPFRPAEPRPPPPARSRRRRGGPPTQDRDAVGTTLNSLIADGGTATGDALDAALTALGTRDKKSPPAAIVLLSDGASQNGKDPAEGAQQAKALGVPIYTVALGTPDGVVQQGGQILNVAPDPEALAQVAQISGGRAFTAEDSDALDSVYQTLGSRIGTKKEKKEISAGFAAAGLLLLGGAAFTSLRWRGRLP